jgi:hypothetical protein
LARAAALPITVTSAPQTLIMTNLKHFIFMIAAAGAPDGEQLDLEELEETAENEAQKEREAALARELEANRKKTGKTVDPLAFALAIHDRTLEDYQPVMPWQEVPPSEKQLAVLAKFGFTDPARIPNKGFASALLGKLIERSKANMSNAKQINLLKRWGIDGAGMTFKDASAAIDSCVKRYGWYTRPPQGEFRV